MSREDFEAVMREALAELPDDIRREMKNLAVLIQDLPAEESLLDFDPPLDPCLYGLYVGTPLPERTAGDPPRLPDQIFVYKRNLERMCADRETLRREIRITLLHEVGHYLGFDEDYLAEKGYA